MSEEQQKTAVKTAPADSKPQQNDRPPRQGGDNRFRGGGARARRGRNDRRGGGGADSNRRGRGRNNKRRQNQDEQQYESRLIQVRRVTRVVKGGKRMSFSALVAVGDMQGKVGIGLMKGVDFQDSVNKATRKAKQNMIKVHLNEHGSIEYPSRTKFKASLIYLKPADSGTGIIAGGFMRPLLELAGVKNVYSKIIGSRNKIAGTQSVFEALKKYQETK
jgi:small subunit ribosomal protein S5